MTGVHGGRSKCLFCLTFLPPMGSLAIVSYRLSQLHQAKRGSALVIVHVLLCVVQGGPHKGWFRGDDKATIMRIIYNNAQAYPSYVITFLKAS